MSRVFTYSGPYLRGLGGLGMAICLDQTQNTIACTDPNCTYGDCGSTDWQQVSGPLCLDQSENQVPCSNPECTYGDCVGPAKPPSHSGTVFGPLLTAATSIPQTPRPSPTVAVPLGAGTFGLWLGSSNMISGVPNWALLLGTVVAAGVVLGGSRGRRR